MTEEYAVTRVSPMQFTPVTELPHPGDVAYDLMEGFTVPWSDATTGYQGADTIALARRAVAVSPATYDRLLWAQPGPHKSASPERTPPEPVPEGTPPQPVKDPDNVIRVREIHVPETYSSTESRGTDIELRRDFVFGKTEKQPDGTMKRLNDIVFDNQFPGGRLGQVAQTGPDEFTVITIPENRHPINDSPWYAFRIQGGRGTANRTITLRMVYAGGDLHRYLPKLSADGQQWQPMDPGAVHIEHVVADHPQKRGRVATFAVTVSEKPLWVAAQELMPSDAVGQWADTLAKESFVTKTTIGTSAKGRDIVMLQIAEGTGNKPWVILVGGQHPPEVTGRMAHMVFVETLCADTPEAMAFRKRFNILVVPLINPDGVDWGHWRHNANGVDTNRDWVDFRQPETKAVREGLTKAVGEGAVAFAIDFHSTDADKIYLLQQETTGTPTGTVNQWVQNLANALPKYRYTTQLVPLAFPAAMNWLNRTFRAPALTYEVGDETPRGQLREIARQAAKALMSSSQ